MHLLVTDALHNGAVTSGRSAIPPGDTPGRDPTGATGATGVVDTVVTVGPVHRSAEPDGSPPVDDTAPGWAGLPSGPYTW
jgi:hypothetical protein